MKQVTIKMILSLLLVSLLFITGCQNKPSSTSQLLSSLDGDLSEDDQASLKRLQEYIQKFEQLNNELDSLLTEMQKNDDLESAVETMEIANQETLYLFNSIELEPAPTNHLVKEVKERVQKEVEAYMSGMNLLLEGITAMDSEKTDKGMEQINNSKKELSEFLALLSNKDK